MVINNSKDANKYYQIVNDDIDNYLSNHNITAKQLLKKMKSSITFLPKFIESNNLTDIEKDKVRMIENNKIKLFYDILVESDEYTTNDDKLSKDIVVNGDKKIANTFNECIYLDIPQSDSQYENVLADYFDTNLGDITPMDVDKHIYGVKSWNSKDMVIIFSKNDLDTIRTNFVNKIYNGFIKRQITIIDDIKMDMKDIIDVNNFTNMIYNIIDYMMICHIVEKYLKDNYKYENIRNDFYIFKKQK